MHSQVHGSVKVHKLYHMILFQNFTAPIRLLHYKKIQILLVFFPKLYYLFT